MPKTAENSSKGKSKEDEIPFEDALKRLESIVETMEAEELPLEGLLSRYEEGVRLVLVCQSRLADAEMKIEQLEKKSTGQVGAKPMVVAGSESPE